MEKKNKYHSREGKEIRIRPCEFNTRVRIPYVPKTLAKELMNISKNSFIPLSKILRKHFEEIVDKYPEIKGQTNNLNHHLTLIAKHHNINKNYFLKTKLREIADSYPERMRRDIIDF